MNTIEISTYSTIISLINAEINEINKAFGALIPALGEIEGNMLIAKATHEDTSINSFRGIDVRLDSPKNDLGYTSAGFAQVLAYSIRPHIRELKDDGERKAMGEIKLCVWIKGLEVHRVWAF